MGRNAFVQKARQVILDDISTNGVPNVAKKTARSIFLEYLLCGDPDGSNIQCGTESIGKACGVNAESARLVRKWLRDQGYLHEDSPSIYKAGTTRKTLWWHVALPGHPCSLGRCATRDGGSPCPRSTREILDKAPYPRNEGVPDTRPYPSSEREILDKAPPILGNHYPPRIVLIHPDLPSRAYRWTDRLGHSCVA